MAGAGRDATSAAEPSTPSPQMLVRKCVVTLKGKSFEMHRSSDARVKGVCASGRPGLRNRAGLFTKEQEDRPMRRAIRTASLFSMIVIAAIVSSCGLAVAQDHLRIFERELVSALDRYAFIDAGDEAHAYVIKWKRPIRMGIINDAGISPGVNLYLAETAKKIADATGRDISVANDAANFVVLFTKDPSAELGRYDALLSNFFPGQKSGLDDFARSLKQGAATCQHKIIASVTKEILGYLLVVVTAAPGAADDTVKACVLAGMMSGMGIGHQRGAGAPSFLPLEEAATLSTAGYAVLHVIYQPELAPGAARSQVMDVVKKLYRPQ